MTPMSFVHTFRQLPERRSPLLDQFLSLLEPVDDKSLEQLASRSSRQTQQYFGKTIRLFAPLYLSNECVNNCKYCGFSRDNPILRVTLTIEQVVKEAQHLHSIGFRNILLVAGEHPKFVSEGYLQECIRAIRDFIPTIAIEVGPMTHPQYREVVAEGAEGLIVYQETYDPEAYRELHTSGPKKNFDWRLECPERAYAGGFRRIGLGALFGLADWRWEALALAAHLEYLQRQCWKASYTVSFPRLRPHAGEEHFQANPSLALNDRDFVQLLCAFRICFPHTGIVVSTRESPQLRDALIPIGATHMSAGSHTEPGGYTQQGNDDLHLTVKGKRVELAAEQRQTSQCATEQFGIADQRPPDQFANSIRSQGYEPVWKDWEQAILCNHHHASAS